MRFRFVAAERAQHDVSRLCTMIGVSRQGILRLAGPRPQCQTPPGSAAESADRGCLREELADVWRAQDPCRASRPGRADRQEGGASSSAGNPTGALPTRRARMAVSCWVERSKATPAPIAGPDQRGGHRRVGRLRLRTRPTAPSGATKRATVPQRRRRGPGRVVGGFEVPPRLFEPARCFSPDTPSRVRAAREGEDFRVHSLDLDMPVHDDHEGAKVGEGPRSAVRGSDIG